MIGPVETRLACQDDVELYDRAIDGHEPSIIQAICSCHGCPVKDACYAHGLETKAAGVFGGVYIPHARYVQKNLCRRGHDLSGPNGRLRWDGNKACRTCERDARRKERAR